MRSLHTVRRTGAVLALMCLAVPLAAQGVRPAPPVPGPYQLAPIPPSVLTAPAAPGSGAAPMGQPMRQTPPPGMRLPYWMAQPDGSGATVETTTPPSAPAATPAAPPAAQTAPMPAQSAQPMPPAAPRPGFGQVAPPGFFPGYGAPQPGGPGTAPTGATRAPMAPQTPQGYQQPYMPQPYGAPPAWGWPSPPGWAPMQPGGGRQ